MTQDTLRRISKTIADLQRRVRELEEQLGITTKLIDFPFESENSSNTLTRWPEESEL